MKYDYYLLHDTQGKGHVFQHQSSLIEELLMWACHGDESIPLSRPYHVDALEVIKLSIEYDEIPDELNMFYLDEEGECSVKYNEDGEIDKITIRDYEYPISDISEQEFVAEYII